MAARVCLLEPVLVERTDPVDECELVAKVRPHHLGAVGRDRERDAVLDEAPERLADIVLVGERLGQEVRGRADLERHARVPDEPHQPGIARGDRASVAAFRRSIAAEWSLIVVVVAVTAAMTALFAVGH